ncbi:hypothetical protein BBP40_009223 [Aspergillus hancockii]|nr:hypothetical protein BBP40_009223 [Aspergillus hancockii]
MGLDQTASFLGFQLLHSLNLLISTSADDVFDHARYLFWRRPPMKQIDYYLSHVASIMLIPESERIHAANHSAADFVNDNFRNHPTTRSLTKSSSLLYQTGGLRMFLKGLKTGMVSFQHYLLQPIANVISTLLLAELHMAWTHATISATSSTGSLLNLRHNHRTWKTLAIPSLVSAGAQAALEYFPAAADSSWTLIFGNTGRGNLPGNYIAYLEVSTMLPTLIMRMGVVLPASIALALVEASFLPQTETTIVPSTKGHRSRMAALVWGKLHKIQSGFRGVYGLVRGSTYFWLWELHVKRCLLQAVVDLVVVFVERVLGP